MYRRIQSIQVIFYSLFLLADDTHGLQLVTGMCMRSEFMFLSTIIPDPNKLGRNIDVYL
jgi:hypothetical protein